MATVAAVAAVATMAAMRTMACELKCRITAKQIGRGIQLLFGLAKRQGPFEHR